TRMVMHRSLTAALAAALWFCLADGPAPSARADAPATAVDDARGRLDRGDARGAVDVLESALPGATGATRTALLDALGAAYPAAARQASSEGKLDEAESYRDNLEILLRRPASAAKVQPATETKPTKSGEPVTGPAVVSPTESLPPLPVMAPLDPPPALPAPESPTAEGPRTNPADRPSLPIPQSPMAEPARGATTEARPPVRLASIPSPSPSPEGARVKAAVEAFQAEKYDDAGKLFAALERDGKLPAEFRSHWAYCRAVEVVRKLNARPSSAQEWAAIDSEIQNIRTLSPSNWFAEYLRNLASERNRDPQARPARSNKVVLRGSSPDEPAASSAPGSPSFPAPTPPPAAGPAPTIPWSSRPVESSNFVVVHVGKDRALAERAAQAAEAARESQVKRWGAAADPWNPRCEIVLFPNARDFARETLQPADSPGFSTMGMNAGKVVLRRVHLRTDHPNMVKAILPHEVAHVVLADLFPTQQIPRWADEGMAVLAEPHSEQAIRAADLNEPLRSGRVFRVRDLMAMDNYPKPEFWGLYYAQSVSLTRFLVETGSPSQFVRFVQQSQKTGVEPALRQVYSVSGFAELQKRWLVYARETSSGSAAITASSDDPTKHPAAPR
ncbi:MAG: hypothetical protein LC745_09320, partial [Planctomycetia bacterium]|nr:hypothetical protein [Planctomycetia bacterium]